MDFVGFAVSGPNHESPTGGCSCSAPACSARCRRRRSLRRSEAALARLRDSLARIEDSAGVRAPAGTGSAGSRTARKDAMTQLRLGLVTLRLAELGDGWKFGDARDAFLTAAELRPDVALGLVRCRPRGKSAGATGRRPRRPTWEPGWDTAPTSPPCGRWARRSIADPGSSPRWRRCPACADLGDSTLAATALDHSRRARTRAGPSATGMWLPAAGWSVTSAAPIRPWPRFRRFAGNPGVHPAHGHSSRRGPGWDRVIPLPWLCTTPAPPRTTPPSVAEYRADLAFVADSGELEAFDAATGEEREGLLRTFWTERDHRDLQPEGSRLVEHYRRLAYARRHYRPAYQPAVLRLPRCLAIGPERISMTAASCTSAMASRPTRSSASCTA